MNWELRMGLLSAILVHAFLFLGLSFVAKPIFEVTVAPTSVEIDLVHGQFTSPLNEVVTKKSLQTPVGEMKQQTDLEEVPKSVENSMSGGDLLKGIFANAKPRVRLNKPPYYPRVARQKGHEGKVVLFVKISDRGSVEDVSVLNSSGYVTLDREAKSAVQKWVFHPAVRLGRKVPSSIQIPISFILKD